MRRLPRTSPDGGRFLIPQWVIGLYRYGGDGYCRRFYVVWRVANVKTRKLLTVFDGWEGIDMATASIEVSGPDAERLARELQTALMTAIQPGDSVSPVEVERSAELVIAIIGLVFSGVGTARTIWDWWHGRRSAGVTVKILLDDGTQVDLSGVDEKQLEIALDRRTPPGIDSKK